MRVTRVLRSHLEISISNIVHPMHLATTLGYDANFRSGVLERDNVHARQDVMSDVRLTRSQVLLR